MALVPQWGQLLSTSVEILPRNSFTTTALWSTDLRKATSLCELCLCQMMFHVREVERGISFRHLHGIDFLRATWEVIEVLSNLAAYAIIDVTSGHHHHALSKKNRSNSPKNKLSWVCALPWDNQSTLTLDIQPKKAVGGTTFLASGCTLVKITYCNPTVDLRKVPMNSALNSTRPKLKSLRYPVQTSHYGIICSTFLYITTHSYEVGLAPCWLCILSQNKPWCSTSLIQKAE